MSENTVTAESEELVFSRSFFGFDPLEVRAYVAKLYDELARLQARGAGDASGARVIEGQDAALTIDSTVNDIAGVLEAARVAARKIRDRAEREASEGAAGAARRARGILAAAETDAFSVRKSAWDTSTELLESAKSEGAGLRRAAERDALDIIGDAERKAHRKLAAARRDSDSSMQMASAESERLLGVARAKAKEIIGAAEERAATILDQVSALEERHEGLRRDVEALQEELEGPSRGSDVKGPSTVRLVEPGAMNEGASGSNGEQQREPFQRLGLEDGSAPAADHAGAADGTRTVRLVSAPTRRDRVEVDAPEMADNMAYLAGRSPGTGAGSGVDGGDIEMVRDMNPARGPLAVDSPASADDVPNADSSRSWTHFLDGATADELAALFNELRTREVAAPVTRRGGPAGTMSPLERYDFELLPIVNRAVRGVKRQLTDMQREQIEALQQDPESWMPERPDFGSYLVHALSVMEREACERGLATAAELSGIRLSPSRSVASAGERLAFIDDLFDGVTASIRTAREHDRSGQDICNDLSTVFRRWRTDEVERRLRFCAGRAYNRGLVDGLDRAGMERLLVVGGNDCDACANPGEVLAPHDLPAVPVHEDCRCTVVPA